MSTEDLSYFQEEEFKKNLALYEQMLQGGQSVYLEADELTDIAEYYLVQNDTDKAMACIQYALNIHPGSIDPLIFLARQKMFNGDIEGAKTKPRLYYVSQRPRSHIPQRRIAVA